MDQLDLSILEQFESITSYRIVDYFIKVNNFFSKHSNNITSYYSGVNKVLNTKSFDIMKELKKDTEDLMETWRLNQTSLGNYKYWILIDNIENVYGTLLSLENSAKWYRSTQGLNDFTTFIPTDIPLTEGQTLESISANALGSNDYDNDWADLALSNDLREEDYTPSGGIIVTANLNKNNKRIEIKSVVDTMNRDTILGKDIAQKITYEDDDLLTVEGVECFKQSIYILMNLRKGQNPEFRSLGINNGLMVGSNVNNITYPTIFRDLTEVLRTDDTIKAFSITDIKRDQDAVFINVEVESRLNEIQEATITF